VKKDTHFIREPIGTVHEKEISIGEEVFSTVSVKEIQKIINQLPRATAAVFNLYIYEGFTHRQVSAALGISEGTSKWHVNEGRRLLKTKLEHFLNPGVKTHAD
jgi:RNA polymerase sigma-70 factor, ECF subfamily